MTPTLLGQKLRTQTVATNLFACEALTNDLSVLVDV